LDDITGGPEEPGGFGDFQVHLGSNHFILERSSVVCVSGVGDRMNGERGRECSVDFFL